MHVGLLAAFATKIKILIRLMCHLSDTKNVDINRQILKYLYYKSKYKTQARSLM